jgi:hypothetical protein
MPRYFFHLHNDVDAEDPEGIELADLAEARERAIVYARDMASLSIVDHGRLILSHRIDVADQSGEIVHTVHFRDVVEVRD